jgi:HAD superfamily hydrolase (TIGR01509 family)
MNQNTVRAVLFDMDGVLVDSLEAWFHLMNSAARDLGYPPISREQFSAYWGQGVDLDVELVFKRHTMAQVEGYYDRHFVDHAGHVRTNPQAKSVFDELRRRGRLLAVITNTPGSIAREVLGHAELEPDVTVGGTDVPRGKPEPDMVVKALDLLGVSRAEAAIVGDSRFDREAAAAAGVRFLGYRTEGEATLDELRDVLRFI